MSNFVDLQVNGHGGIDFLSAKSADEVRIAARSLAKNGVEAFLPTLITSDFALLSKAASFIQEVRERPLDGEARILGIHLEGPFISQEKCGVHPKQHIAPIDFEYVERLMGIGDVKIMTLAPELPGAVDLISLLVERGVVVSLGHSNATKEEAQRGFDAGAKTVTHLFNAMSKDGGLAEAALEREDVMIQIIVDDVHVPREKVADVIKRVGERFIVTNDAVAAAGLGEGTFLFGDMNIKVENNQARRIDGTLAGGVATLADSLFILREIGISDDNAFASVTTRPLALIS